MSKFIWTAPEGLTISALRKPGPRSTDYSNPGFDTVTFITEEDMEEVAEWCQENSCGRRISFDTFRFKRPEDITMFLLRWS